eukprot:271373_1
MSSNKKKKSHFLKNLRDKVRGRNDTKPPDKPVIDELIKKHFGDIKIDYELEDQDEKQISSNEQNLNIIRSLSPQKESVIRQNIASELKTIDNDNKIEHILQNYGFAALNNKKLSAQQKHIIEYFRSNDVNVHEFSTMEPKSFKNKVVEHCEGNYEELNQPLFALYKTIGQYPEYQRIQSKIQQKDKITSSSCCKCKCCVNKSQFVTMKITNRFIKSDKIILTCDGSKTECKHLVISTSNYSITQYHANAQYGATSAETVKHNYKQATEMQMAMHVGSNTLHDEEHKQAYELNISESDSDVADIYQQFEENKETYQKIKIVDVKEDDSDFEHEKPKDDRPTETLKSNDIEPHGLASGDVLCDIDGENINGLERADVVKLLKFCPLPVELTFERKTNKVVSCARNICGKRKRKHQPKSETDKCATMLVKWMIKFIKL